MHAVIAVLGAALPAQAYADSPTVTVDFARRVAPVNAIGLMHGALPSAHEDVRAECARRAALIKPGIWRGVQRDWSFSMEDVSASGATPVIQLSALWGLPGHWPSPWPHENPAAWEAWVRRKAEGIGRWVRTGPVWVDIWNEPDSRKYWPVGTDPKLEHWMETWATAERAIRDVLGDRARIVGPSTLGRQSLWTARLVRYCSSHGCRLDGVAWHSLGTARTMRGLGAALRKARRRAKIDPEWRRVLGPAPRFFVTEYNPFSRRHDPGALLAYWSQLEAGGADGAAMSVWTHSGADVDGLLDGLLDTSCRPRATWWAARAYADGNAARVRAEASDPLRPALATASGTNGRPEILIGSYSHPGARVRLRVTGLHRREYTASAAVFWPVRAPWAGHVTPPHWTAAGRLRVRRGVAETVVRVPGGAMVSVLLR